LFYFISLDRTDQQLWITLIGSFSASMAIGIASGPAAPTIERDLPRVCGGC
jgi:hypothetical protein